MKLLQCVLALLPLVRRALASDCVLSPLGDGLDDTDQVNAYVSTVLVPLF